MVYVQCVRRLGDPAPPGPRCGSGWTPSASLCAPAQDTESGSSGAGVGIGPCPLHPTLNRGRAAPELLEGSNQGRGYDSKLADGARLHAQSCCGS